MRCEVLKAVKMLMLAFWVVMPCAHVGRYQHFRGKALKMKAVYSSKFTWRYNPEG
jgi:hypothetical protein